jgi:hypothetical protein
MAGFTMRGYELTTQPFYPQHYPQHGPAVRILKRHGVPRLTPTRPPSPDSMHSRRRSCNEGLNQRQKFGGCKWSDPHLAALGHVAFVEAFDLDRAAAGDWNHAGRVPCSDVGRN